MAGLWLRLYTEIRNDRKLRRLSPAQRWLWVVILTIAKESPKPGYLLLSEGVPVTIEDLADDAAIPLDEVKSGIEAFVAQRMLEQVDGVWRLVNWDKRQFSSDSSTERVRKHRRKKQQNETLQDRYSNVTETPPETDKQTNRDRDRDIDQGSCLTTATAQCAEADGDAPPTNKDLIAELTGAYRAIEGIKPAKGDYAFVGALYNQYGYDQVLTAINKLQMAAAVQQLEKPLLYLKGILEKQEREPPKKHKVDEKKKQLLRSLYLS
jgi:hypothetical protein